MAEPGAKVTVVVANTDPTVCEVLGRVVESGGHEAVRVTDAGLVSGAVLSAPAEAAVLDLEAANVEQLRALRGGGSDRGASARVVVISSGPANSLLAWQAGADAVLTRPFHADELTAAVAESLARDDAERARVRASAIVGLSR